MDIAYKKEIFYCTAADTSILLSDEEIVRFSKGILCFHVRNDAFLQMFFGPLQNGVIEFTDMNSSEFKLLLNCLMGFEAIDKEKAKTIFPAVWKYQIDDAIDACVDLLKPEGMSDDMLCDIINYSYFYDCRKLKEATTQFVSQNFRYRILLENERYCSLLWPDSVRHLLEFVEVDSHLALIVLNWGDNFIKNYGLKISLRDFFKNYGIMKMITPFCFESIIPFVKFLVSPLGKNFFTVNEIQSYKSKFKNSEWRVMGKSDTFTENFCLVKCFTSVDGISKLDIFRNDIIICSEPDKDHFYYCALNVTDDNFDTLFDQCIYFGDKVSHDYKMKNFSVEVVCRKVINVLNVKLKWTFECDCRILLRNSLISETDKCSFMRVKWVKNSVGDNFVKSLVL